jgi:hypothetical protein
MVAAGDMVAALRQKRFGGTSSLQVVSGVEERMAEVTHLHIVLRQQQRPDGLAADRVLFPIF